jgi:hypothetical protein
MDIIVFLCVSLGSSTVKFYDSLSSRCTSACSEAGISSQNGDWTWGVYYRRAALLCVFRGQKDLIQRIFINKYFLFTVGSVRRVKLFHLGGKRLVDEEVEVEVWKWLRQQSKRLLCCGFRRIGKAMGQVYQCWWRICRISHVLRFISLCDLFADSLSYL